MSDSSVAVDLLFGSWFLRGRFFIDSIVCDVRSPGGNLVSGLKTEVRNLVSLIHELIF